MSLLTNHENNQFHYTEDRDGVEPGGSAFVQHMQDKDLRFPILWEKIKLSFSLKQKRQRCFFSGLLGLVSVGCLSCPASPQLRFPLEHANTGSTKK